MSICTIYAIHEESNKKYQVGTIQNHYDMNTWLQTNGKQEYTYEVHKGTAVHSIWIWKEKTDRWGRTATPSTKKIIIINDDDKPPPKDRRSRKKARQENAKSNKEGRQPRS